jgi:hypothetical protein
MATVITVHQGVWDGTTRVHVHSGAGVSVTCDVMGGVRTHNADMKPLPMPLSEVLALTVDPQDEPVPTNLVLPAFALAPQSDVRALIHAAEQLRSPLAKAEDALAEALWRPKERRPRAKSPPRVSKPP